MSAQALIDTYRAAYLEILERIATKRLTGNATAFEESLKADIERILLELGVWTEDWLQKNVPEIYRDGQQYVQRQLAGMGLQPPPLSMSGFTGIHRGAVAMAVDNLSQDLGMARRHVGRAVDDLFRQAGLAAITRKVSTGQTIRETQQALRNQLASQGIAAFTDKRGRKWQLDTYAEMVARSTTRETTNQAALNQLSGLGYDLVKMTKHAPTCPLCAPREGRVYSISGRDTRYPPLWGTAFGQYASIHPNCSHVLRPYVEALADDAEADRIFSNRPFDLDPRSEGQKRAYEGAQARKREARRDLQHWERYKARLPNDTPAFPGFVRMKRANSERYQELQQLYRDAGRTITGE